MTLTADGPVAPAPSAPRHRPFRIPRSAPPFVSPQRAALTVCRIKLERAAHLVATFEPAAGYAAPRQEHRLVATLAQIVNGLREIIDQLRDDVPRGPRPQMIVCEDCGRTFKGNRRARFCGGACRIRSWRARQ